MNSLYVSTHAAERWIERVQPSATMDQARAAIQASAEAVRKAAAFGCRFVRLGCGARLVLDGERVVTVYGHWQKPDRRVW